MSDSTELAPAPVKRVRDRRNRDRSAERARAAARRAEREGNREAAGDGAPETPGAAATLLGASPRGAVTLRLGLGLVVFAVGLVFALSSLAGAIKLLAHALHPDVPRGRQPGDQGPKLVEDLEP